MARYFFSTANGARHADDEGLELPSIAAARVAAIQHAGAIMADEPDVLWDGQDFRVEVTDHEGMMLFTVIAITVDAPVVSAPQDGRKPG